MTLWVCWTRWNHCSRFFHTCLSLVGIIYASKQFWFGPDIFFSILVGLANGSKSANKSIQAEFFFDLFGGFDFSLLTAFEAEPWILFNRSADKSVDAAAGAWEGNRFEEFESISSNQSSRQSDSGCLSDFSFNERPSRSQTFDSCKSPLAADFGSFSVILFLASSDGGSVVVTFSSFSLALLSSYSSCSTWGGN